MTLTQSGDLPPVLVAGAFDIFGWWPFGGRPRSEVDVHQLEILRTTARRMRLTARRGRRLATSRSGHALLADPTELWHTVARGVGSFNEYARTVSELVAMSLLAGPAEDDDLAATAIPIIRAQGWRRGRRALDDGEIRWSIYEPLRYWRLFRLLGEQEAK